MKKTSHKNRNCRLSRFSSIILLFLIAVLCFASCNKVTDVIKEPPRTLEVPANLRLEGTNLCWNPVENVTRYLVSVDGKEYYSDDNVYSIAGISDGDYVFKVKAIGDSVVYESSGFSADYPITLYNGEVARGGYYSQFDDLTKNESFLGYGFDVIRSSVFSDKYVKTSYPLFKHDELMKQRLLKVDSKYVYVDEIQSSSMEEFMSNWNVNANVNVNWGNRFVGGSVGVEAAYSGGTETTRSKYFHSMSFNNQEFYIVMQSDMNTLRSIISDGFKNDLYSDIEPSELFNDYGTHFITSAVMGGKIISYYLYTSEEEKDFHDISGKVSVEVRYWKGETDVEVSGGYRREAEKQNIEIKNTIEVIGGSDFGIKSDADIATHYAAWEKSLTNHASLMGIKDTGSLQPIWELIDPALDTKTYSWDYDGDGIYETGNRSQQLQAYFMRYGTNSYNKLMEAASLPKIVEPTEISDVLVNNLPANERGEYEVYAGVENNISFTVLPTDAVGYTKTISLASTSEYAKINENGQLVIDAIIPQNESVLTIVLSAGSARKQINVRIIRTYTVDFVTNSNGVTVDTLYNVREGSQIFEPEIPGRVGYNLVGWYTSADFNEESKYEFGTNAIMGHTTLYAKWEPVHPVVHVVSSIDGSMSDITVKFNALISELELPAPEGHTFGGCYKDDGFIDEWANDTVITTNITVYVKWIPKKYAVTFNSMGGSAVESQSIPYGSFAAIPEAPAKVGYTFTGWYSDSKCENRFDFYLNNITQAITVYAGWVEFYPTVTVKSNVASGSLTQWSEQIAYGKTLSTVIMPEIQGYYLAGFYTTEQRLNEFDIKTQITEDVTVYAKYEKIAYAVTFNSMGGSAVASQSVLFGENAAVPESPTKAGYTFAGWYADSKCETPFDFYVNAITQTTTVYAAWVEFYPTVTVKSNVANGNLTQWSEQIAYGKALTAVTVPEIYGYTFVGFYTTEERMNPCDMSQQVTADITVYAKYERNKYTVTFNSMGGSAVESQSVLFGELAAVPQNPIKAGYIFLGWYSDSKYENRFDFYVEAITEATTLYAAWVEFYPTVTVKSNVASNGVTQWSEQISYAKTLAAVTVPEIYGYTFVGFYTTEERLNEFDKAAEITEDVTVYAKYEQNKYTVSFDTEGGSDVASQTVTHGLRANEPTEPKKEGYIFVGWYTDTDFETAFDFSRTKIESDVTAYAKWEKFYPTVSFTSNVQDYVGYTESVNYGTVMQEPAEPSLRGHKFLGYYADSKLLNEFDFTQPIKNNTVIYVKWEKVNYTVTFDSEGGSSVASQTLAFGSKITRPTTPTKEGYSFVGWNREDGTRFDFSSMMVEENITLYAEWTQEQQVIISFDSLGGSAHDSQNAYVNKALGDDLPIPTKAGYTFVAWYKTAEYLEADRIYANTTFVENTVLYAKWTANKYTVTLDANGGDVTMESFDVTFDGKYGGNLPVPTKMGYNFSGWYTKTSGGNLVTAETAVVIAENHTLYARWTAYVYTIQYNGNGATGGSMENTEHMYDASANLAANTYYKTGYLFNGWNTKADGSGKAYENSESVKNITTVNEGNVTLYAQWKKNTYTVTFDANGGTVTTTGKTVTYDLKYGADGNLPVPQRTGYTFGGWYNGSTYVTSESIVKTASNHTLKAKWNVNNYTVKYEGNGATGGSTANSSHVYDVSKQLTANGFVRTGYTFAGWATSASGSVVYKDKASVKNLTATNGATVTLYAKWTPNTYVVTLGNTGKTINVVYDSKYGINGNVLPTPVWTGHTFGGWYNGSTKVDLNTIVKTASDHTLTAKWTANTYTVTFDANGGTVTPTGKTVTYDLKYGANGNLPVPQRTGYTFGGWYNGSTYVTSESIVKTASNHTLKANWKVNNYTVKYEGNGATGGSTANSSHVYDVSKQLTANGFVRTGYTFAGWATSASGSVVYKDKVSVKNLTATNGATVTLYAKWTPNTYVVTLGNTGKTINVVYDAKYGINGNLPTPTKTGYNFSGWYNGSTKVDSNTIVKTASNHTLSEKWTAKVYTVTYNSNGGTGTTASSQHTYDASKQLTANGFARNGYTFAGWSTSATGGVAYYNGTTVKNISNTGTNVTLYAVWKVDPYTISKYVSDKATVKDTNGANTYTVYKSIDSTPLRLSGNVILDWSGESETDMLKHTSRVGTEGRYSNLGFTNTAKNIYFIGKAGNTYNNLCLFITNYQNSQALKLSFTDFKFVANDLAIQTWNDNGQTSNVVNLTIETRGTCAISTSVAGGTAIRVAGYINFIGNGTMTIDGGDGANGTGDGGKGKDGGIAIKVENLSFQMTAGSGKVIFNGGNGGNGANGYCAPNDGENGHSGGKGGAGGIAVDANTIRFASGTIEINGGNGGNGGGGGCCNPDWFAKEKGGDGGAGGAGGMGITANTIFIGSGSASVNGGDGGNGGTKGGAYQNQDNHIDGSQGSGGAAGVAVNTLCNIIDSYNNGKFNDGAAGSKGTGVRYHW